MTRETSLILIINHLEYCKTIEKHKLRSQYRSGVVGDKLEITLSNLDFLNKGLSKYKKELRKIEGGKINGKMGE